MRSDQEGTAPWGDCSRGRLALRCPRVPTARSPRIAFLVAERVPGAYETPLVAKKLLEQRDVDALVVLGFIERGETLHGEVMGHVVHRSLLELGLARDKPVGLGLIGPGATKKQAEARKKGSAKNAVRAVHHTLEALAALES
jgi:6,7-dimethyl-8-ribityllumazine synthase